MIYDGVSVTCLPDHGTGALAIAVDPRTPGGGGGPCLAAMAVGDVEADGTVDPVVTPPGNAVEVWRGTGTGTVQDVPPPEDRPPRLTRDPRGPRPVTTGVGEQSGGAASAARRGPAGGGARGDARVRGHSSSGGGA